MIPFIITLFIYFLGLYITTRKLQKTSHYLSAGFIVTVTVLWPLTWLFIAIAAILIEDW